MSPQLQIYTLSALSDNYIYVVRDPIRQKTLVVDPASAQPVFEFLRQKQWDLDMILNTHHHADHVGGNLALQKKYNCPIYCSPFDFSRIPGATHALSEGQQLKFGDSIFEIWEIPGHTTGHLGYYCAQQNLFFCGDTLFAMGCGRLFEGTATQMHSALKRMAHLPFNTQFYCTHEYTLANAQFAQFVEPDNPDLMNRIQYSLSLRAKDLPTLPTSLEWELKTNPFLRPHSASIRKKLGLIGQSDLEVFTALRELKNGFKTI